MKYTLMLLLSAALISCGGKEKEEVVKLDAYEDRLSYVLGAVNAQMFTETKDGNFDKLDKKEIIAGFKDGLKADDASACNDVLKNLFGPDGQQFNETYMKEGANCIGRLTAVNFMKEIRSVGEEGKLREEKLILGFEMALFGTDTLIEKSEQRAMMDEFFNGIKAREQERVMALDGPHWEKVKAIKGIKALEEGVYLQVIKEGTGANPTALDDVEAHYVLTNTKGEVMESTRESGEPIKINLTHGMGGGIIKGWTIGFAAMKKGGKYNLFIPSDLAYGQGALSFEVELLSFGPQGSLVKLQQPVPGM